MRVRKAEARKAATRKNARSILEAAASGNIDAYEAYRQLYGIWRSSNAAVPELRPLFSISFYEPDGILSVSDDFRREIISVVRKIIADHTLE